MRGIIIKIIIFLVAGLLSITGCVVNTSKNPTESDAAEAILRSLNVSEVDNPPDLETTTTLGTTEIIDDPNSWNPLKTEYAVFAPKAEMMQIGITDGSYAQTLFQDGDSDYDSTHPIPTGNSWVEEDVKMSTTADLDGDGIDEIIVFFLPVDPDDEEPEDRVVSCMVYHDGSFSDTFDFSTGIIQASTYADDVYTSSFTPFYRYWDLDSADVDGDGIDEILFTNYKTARIMNINADGSSYDVLEKKTFGEAVTEFTGGDCDGDGEDELLVGMMDSGFALYDSSFGDSMLSPEFTNPDTEADITCGAFGDFDGDNIDEIAVIQSDGSALSLNLYSFSNDLLAEEYSAGIPSIILYDYIRMTPRALDIDGDGTDELAFGNYVFHDVMDDMDEYSTVISNPDAIVDIQTGDVDADAKEDLIYLYADSLSTNIYSPRVTAYGVENYGDWNDIETKKSYLTDLTNWIFSSMATLCSMTAGNVDDDSQRVRYTGHELEFTTPTIIATLASPPYYSSIADAVGNDYNYGSWVTTFGETSAQSSTDANSVGFSVGTSVEFEQGISVFGVNVAEFKTSASFTSSTSWDFTTGTSISKSVTYSCSGGEDRVIFTSVPMDIYSYEIIYSPDAEEIGSTLYIKIPRDCSTYTVQKNFYNENNGDLPDIPSTVLPHTLGLPSSYPDEDEKEALMDEYGGYEVGPSTVAQGTGGSGTTTLDISVESTQEETISVDFSTDIMNGVGAAGVTVSETLGFNSGYSYTSASTEGTSFGGTVGFLPTAYYTSYSYSSGLFVIKYEDDQSGQSWWAINYWME